MAIGLFYHDAFNHYAWVERLERNTMLALCERWEGNVLPIHAGSFPFEVLVVRHLHHIFAGLVHVEGDKGCSVQDDGKTLSTTIVEGKVGHNSR